MIKDVFHKVLVASTLLLGTVLINAAIVFITGGSPYNFGVYTALDWTLQVLYWIASVSFSVFISLDVE